MAPQPSCSSPLHRRTRPPQRIRLIDDLVRRTGAGPPPPSYTEPLPRHRLPRSRICFPEADAKRRSTTVVDNELTPVADHDSQRPPQPSCSSPLHRCTRPPQRICLIDDIVRRTGAGPSSFLVHGASSPTSSSTVSDLLPGSRRQAQKHHRHGQ